MKLITVAWRYATISISFALLCSILLLGIATPAGARAAASCHITQTTPEAATLFVEGLEPLAPHHGYEVFLFAPSGVLLFTRSYNPPGGSEPFLDPEHGTYEGQVWLTRGEGAEHNSFTKVKELASCSLVR